ncbi:MAG: thiamine-phosphate kinase [Candidatus Helarchaeota archaeon]|nr:thiamine-phosphate kinase [Candidatus Helarchaeota archaeon]
MPDELSEIRIIEIFRKYFKTQPRVYMGVADPKGLQEDAGAIRLGNKKLLVVTTDLIGKKTHIPPKMTLFQMGRKAVIVNISDLAAMGAEPLGIVFSVGLPRDITIEEVENLAKGMNAGAEEYNTCVFGGDTNQADDIILAGTAVGLTTEEQILLRSGAQENDIVAVTGWIGQAALGLYFLKKEINVDENLLKSVLEPQARLSEALALNKLNAITSAGDITDGLALELHKIGEASEKGILIQEEKLPIREEVKSLARAQNLDPVEIALHVGEDFELVLTITPEKWPTVKKRCDEMNLKITQIGTVTKDKEILMESSQGELIPLKKEGYDQFTTKF